jgi:hypothetical protein
MYLVQLQGRVHLVCLRSNGSSAQGRQRAAHLVTPWERSDKTKPQLGEGVRRLPECPSRGCGVGEGPMEHTG